MEQSIGWNMHTLYSLQSTYKLAMESLFEITTIAHILNCLCFFTLKCNYSMVWNIWIKLHRRRHGRRAQHTNERALFCASHWNEKCIKCVHLYTLKSVWLAERGKRTHQTNLDIITRERSEPSKKGKAAQPNHLNILVRWSEYQSATVIGLFLMQTVKLPQKNIHESWKNANKTQNFKINARIFDIFER